MCGLSLNIDDLLSCGVGHIEGIVWSRCGRDEVAMRSRCGGGIEVFLFASTSLTRDIQEN